MIVKVKERDLPWYTVVFKIENNDKEIHGIFSSLEAAGDYIDQYATKGEVWAAEEFQLDMP